MIKLIIRKFIKDCDNTKDRRVRERYGILGGILGIICNAFLFALKLIIGLMMNSMAIMSDAFNNLSDMGSSFVTIVGAKLSNLRPDREHPFGHGRLEYISSLIVSFIIMLVGFELLKTSVGKIIEPEELNFSLPMIIILCLSVLVKVWMFSYNRYMGNKIDSTVLKATASDSLNDVIATSAVIVTTIIGRLLHFPALDGIVGTVVALMIIYSGFEIARDTVGLLLGTPPSPELVEQITGIVMAAEGVVGTHDLIVHDYGPGRVMASVHAEVFDDVSIVKMHEQIDAAEKRAAEELGLTLVIHMDPISVNCETTNAIREQLLAAIEAVDPRFTIHDFRVVNGENNVNLIFDMVVPIEMKENEVKEKTAAIKAAAKGIDERYNCVIQIDYS